MHEQTGQSQGHDSHDGEKARSDANFDFPGLLQDIEKGADIVNFSAVMINDERAAGIAAAIKNSKNLTVVDLSESPVKASAELKDDIDKKLWLTEHGIDKLVEAARSGSVKLLFHTLPDAKAFQQYREMQERNDVIKNMGRTVVPRNG